MYHYIVEAKSLLSFILYTLWLYALITYFALGFPWRVTSSSQWSVSRIVHRKTPCARNWFVVTTIAQCAVMMPLHIPIIAICKWLRVRLAYNWHILGNALKVRYSEKATKIWKIFHFVLTLICNFKNSGIFFFSNFEAFSQYLNFKDLRAEETCPTNCDSNNAAEEEKIVCGSDGNSYK